ncbi:surfeit locus 1 family protein [Fistulifera solaris]|uniref:SURF1-like protein n=1 Tax=Fistulifera solaris TaxID=1519565 RepID=A0A1Z5KAR4_FISSO|nr:surfeit locus 1 family protein [Fistulifera solaris]|eukprot:GAX23350.1 surfeit locus 1 family protein [Fistulifera solaris]
MSSSKGLSKAGQVFFGGLCVGTFGLGTWQTQRYFEKIRLMEERQSDLQKAPTETFNIQEIQQQTNNFCQLQLQGRYDHRHEFLVGPRGPPPGALPDTAGGGGISSAPQGYFVMTPFILKKTGETVLVNRGWVPRAMVVPDRRQSSSNASRSDLLQWDRPDTVTDLVVVPARAETPKSLLVAQHDFQAQPPRLFWYDQVAMQAAAGLPLQPPSLIVTAIQNKNQSSLPLRPPVEHVGDFKVTPAIHVGYAATWYGLSLAGVYMTRMLLRR